MAAQMHPYVTDSDERKIIPLWLATMSIFASWLLHTYFQTINFSPPWWSDIPSFVGFYEIFFRLFDKWLWKFGIFRKVGLIKTPNLNGEWAGHTISSHDNHEKQTKATIVVHQTWTEIRVKLATSTSISYSQTASIMANKPDCIVLSYDYINEPRPEAAKTMHSHKGMAMHEYVIDNEDETLDGSYFTGRDRKTFGALVFKRNSD